MGFIDSFIKKITTTNRNNVESDNNDYLVTDPNDYPTEYCMRCYADLERQKGFRKDLPYWVCRGCGEMCINPDAPSDIVWICDKCGATLNLQNGFDESQDKWKCLDCGFINKIDPSEIYLSEEEFQSAYNNPYKGLSDDEMLTLSCYEEIGNIADKANIFLVEDIETKKKYVKKILNTYDKSVYEYLIDNPIANMPKLLHIFESDNALIVIEEYIEGSSLLDVINSEKLEKKMAISIAKDVCRILRDLHSLPKPIIHRDVKPSNIIISSDNTVCLLDMNVAKWYKEGEVEDTKLLGTWYYASPEQLGYGFSASTEKADIYAVGVLLNVMLTGKLPKEEKAEEPIWSIIERCVSLDADKRYTAKELLTELEGVLI